MYNAQSLKVYCSDLRCANESFSSSGAVVLRSKRHRRMSYVGKRRVGITYHVLTRVFDPGNPVEIGTYHLYSCPVCGQEAIYLEKRGLIRRFG